jgi:hypothetical protein
MKKPARTEEDTMRALSTLFRSEAGNVSLLFGFTAVPLLLCLGGATDLAQQSRYRAATQAALDAAALAGARSVAEDLISRGGNDIDYARAEARARTSFDENVIPRSGEVTFHFSHDATKVTTEAEWQMPANFLPLIGIATLPVRGLAEAALDPKAETCIHITAPRDPGVTMTASSQLNAECNVRVESDNARAISLTASSDMKAEDICSNGDTYLWATSTVTPTPRPCAASYIDPFRNLSAPDEAAGPCMVRDFKQKGDVDLRPGVYCGTTEIAPASHVRLAAGVYVFRDGGLVIDSGSSAEGDDILLYFTGKNAGLHVGDGAHFAGKGRQSGVFRTILIDTARDCEDCAHVIRPGGAVKLDGVVYTPTAPFQIQSHGSSVSAPGSMFVAYQLGLASSARFEIKASGSGSAGGATAFADTAIIRLVK